MVVVGLVVGAIAWKTGTHEQAENPDLIGGDLVTLNLRLEGTYQAAYIERGVATTVMGDRSTRSVEKVARVPRGTEVTIRSARYTGDIITCSITSEQGRVLVASTSVCTTTAR